MPLQNQEQNKEERVTSAEAHSAASKQKRLALGSSAQEGPVSRTWPQHLVLLIHEN